MSRVERRGLLLQGALLSLLPLAGCKKGAVTCPPATLQPADMQQRTALKYVDKAETPDKACQLCQQWLEGTDGGCGTCKLLKGPVHPDGSCIVFAKRG